jgi:hypothetical protein
MGRGYEREKKKKEDREEEKMVLVEEEKGKNILKINYLKHAGMYDVLA